MNSTEAMKQIKRGQVSPIYLCWGKEAYLMEEFIRYMQQQLIPEEYREFAVSKYHLNETSLQDIIEDAETVPFMTERKLILADGAYFFTAVKAKSKVEHDLDALVAYLKSPAEHTVLVFMVNAEKLDERKKFVKTLKSRDAIIPFQSPALSDLNHWIEARAAKAGFRIDEPAVEYLILNIGANLQQLNAEMIKLAAFAGDGGRITLVDAEQLIVRSVEQNVFAMIDQVARLKIDKAISMLYELLEQREEPIKLIALIARQFRIVLQVKELAERGYTHQQMASDIGLHPYAAKIAMEQGNRLTVQQLTTWLDQLADLDYKMKTGRIDKALGLELFMLRLAG